MVNYKNSKIYKITNTDNDNIYVGSTCQALCQRLAKHKFNYGDWQKGKYGYTTAYEILKLNGVRIELLELCPCNSKEEISAREAHHIRTLVCVNHNIPNRTDAQYRIDTRDIKNQKGSTSIQCACGKSFTVSHKQRHLRSVAHLIEINK